MRKIFSILILAALVTGCAVASHVRQGQELREAYDKGEITVAQYYQLEQQRRALWQQRVHAIGQGLQNTADYMQRDRAINAMNQPQTIVIAPAPLQPSQSFPSPGMPMLPMGSPPGVALPLLGQ